MFSVYQERHRTKQLLAAQEILFPDLYSSLLTAMKPLMARDRVGLESSKMKKGNYEGFLWEIHNASIKNRERHFGDCGDVWQEKVYQTQK